jgi:hypothetical protein
MLDNVKFFKVLPVSYLSIFFTPNQLLQQTK